MTTARRTYRFTTHEQAALDEGRYWRRRSAEERVSAVELLRRACPGIYDQLPARMERVYRFVVHPSQRGKRAPTRRRAR